MRQLNQPNSAKEITNDKRLNQRLGGNAVTGAMTKSSGSSARDPDQDPTQPSAIAETRPVTIQLSSSSSSTSSSCRCCTSSSGSTTNALCTISPTNKTCVESTLVANSQKPQATRRRRPLTSRKDEIEVLRVHHMQLLELLQHLQRQKHQNDQGATKWQLLAKHQAARKHQALQENAKLRLALKEHHQVKEMLQKLFGRVDSPPRTFATREDFEWKLGVLSLHPERRRLNADLMMNHLYSQIPTRSLRNGLFHTTTPTRYSKTYNLELLDQTVYQEVNFCARFHGDYRQIADLYWQDHVEHLSCGENYYVLNEITERFDPNTIQSTATTYYAPPPSQEELLSQLARPRKPPVAYRSSGGITRTVSRRIDDRDSVTRLFMGVFETMDEEASSHDNIVERVNGWFTVQDGGLDEHGIPITIFKCNMTSEFRPITHRLNKMVMIANRMRMGNFPDPAMLDFESRRVMEMQVRRALAQFGTNVMWTNSCKHEAMVAKHSKTVMENPKM